MSEFLCLAFNPFPDNCLLYFGLPCSGLCLSTYLHHVSRRQAMRKHCLQLLEGDAIVLALMLLPMLSLETQTNRGRRSWSDTGFEKKVGWA